MPTPGSGKCGSTPNSADSEKQPQHDPIADLKSHAAEMWAYVGHLVAAKFNARVHSIKRAALATALGMVVVGVSAVALATAVVLALVGFTNGLGILLGGRVWLAQIIVGVGMLGLMALTLLIIRNAMLKKWKLITAAKFEGRAHAQRIRFQRDVVDAAGAYLRERVSFGATGPRQPGPEANGDGD